MVQIFLRRKRVVVANDAVGIMKIRLNNPIFQSTHTKRIPPKNISSKISIVLKKPVLTNNPKKVIGLDSYGLKLAERVPIIIPSNPENDRYMKTKKTKMGHLLDDEKSGSK